MGVDDLNDEQKIWLVAQTVIAVNGKNAPGTICLMPGCGAPAEGRLALFDVRTRFATILPLCQRCYEMLEDYGNANKAEVLPDA